MNSNSRLKEIHFYDWYISRWQTSDAHDELDATGRGIYREMLDVCYAQGSVTSNADILCRRCACSHEELEARWSAIRRHFQADKRTKGKLVNKHATMFRRTYFKFRTAQARKGAKGGSKSGTRKANKDSEIGSSGLSPAKPLLKPEASLERERVLHHHQEREFELNSAVRTAPKPSEQEPPQTQKVDDDDFESRIRKRHPTADHTRIIMVVSKELETAGVPMADFLELDGAVTISPGKLVNPAGHYRSLAQELTSQARNGVSRFNLAATLSELERKGKWEPPCSACNDGVLEGGEYCGCKAGLGRRELAAHLRESV